MMNNFVRGTFGKPNQENTYQIMNSIQRTSMQQSKERGSLHEGISRQKMIRKLNNISQQFYEVIFLKESIMSMVGEQRVKMGDFMRELKKYLFQLGVKAERQLLSKQARGANQSSILQPNPKIIATNELQAKYDQLFQQHEGLKKKYESMLIHCRQEIQQLSSALAKPLQNLNHNSQHELKMLLLQSQEQLKHQQNRFAQRVKYLQSQIVGLQDEYLRQREMYQKQLEQYRQRQRQLAFQQSELQRKNIILIEREKMLTERQIISKQERATLERRQNKISDYEHNQLRRQKQKKQQQRQTLRSQYFINYEQERTAPHSNRFIDTRTERQRSSNGRLINSRIDINARLREIQMEKRNNGGFKNSRLSDTGLRTERSSSKNKNQYMGVRPPAIRKQGSNVNIKLQSMLHSLQKDLSDMN